MSRQTVSSVASTITVGLELGYRFLATRKWTFETGVIAEGRLRTTPDALRRHFAGREPLPVVMEVGTHSPWVSRLVEQLGHQVFVANARKVRLIYANDSKTDKVDPITLARVGRLDPQLLSPIRHRAKAAQVELARLHARDFLVRARLPSTSTPAFARNAAPHIPEALQPALQPLLDTIETLSQQIQGAGANSRPKGRSPNGGSATCKRQLDSRINDCRPEHSKCPPHSANGHLPPFATRPHLGLPASQDLPQESER